MIYRCPADKHEPLSAFIVPHADREIKPPIYLRPTLAADTLYTVIFSKERSNTNMNTLFPVFKHERQKLRLQIFWNYSLKKKVIFIHLALILFSSPCCVSLKNEYL